MAFIVLLMAGTIASLYFFLNHQPTFGIESIAGSLVAFFAGAVVKKKHVMKDPVKREALERKRRSLQRRLGIVPYNARVDQGILADAAILKITDTGGRTNENPRLLFHLEVRPQARSFFTLDVEKTIPYVLLPQFQPGKVFAINYDPADPRIMGFLSYKMTEVPTINLEDYSL